MSLKRPSQKQPESFEFNSISLDLAKKIISTKEMGVAVIEELKVLSGN